MVILITNQCGFIYILRIFKMISKFEDSCINGDKQIIDQMITNGNINSTDLNGRDGYLLLIIVKNGMLDSLALILKKFGNFIECKPDMLIMALNYNQLECAKLLGEYGVNPDLPTYSTMYERWQKVKNMIRSVGHCG